MKNPSSVERLSSVRIPMLPATPPNLDQPDSHPEALVGCLLDVSGSMRNILETRKGEEGVIERLQAVLQAALRLARAEQRQNPDALMFIGAFGLHNERIPVVDLCGLIDSLLGNASSLEYEQSGHKALTELANVNNVAYVSKYIETELTDHQARVVCLHLQRHKDKIQEFIDAIPPQRAIRHIEEATSTINRVAKSTGGPFGGLVEAGGVFLRDITVTNSRAMNLARSICDEWLLEFEGFAPRQVSQVIHLLERLLDRSSLESDKKAGGWTLLDDLRPYMYGRTPMKTVMGRALSVFRENPDIEQRALVMISDGHSTDGDPLQAAEHLKQEKVTIANVFLTDDKNIPRRRLYDQTPPKGGFNRGQCNLFNMASRIAVTKHPVPVLASMGWNVPSSGECALYTEVCSSDTLEMFCSLLLSARFGSADALLDILGRVRLDAYVDDAHMRTRNNPSNQKDSPTCYAHAIAAVYHMALLRIVNREGGCPSIAEIRGRILHEFPPEENGRNVKQVLNETIKWYRPLRFTSVDENGARQAVLHRRPVIATFRLSEPGWNQFGRHFDGKADTRSSILTQADMAPHTSLPDGGGHAVVLVSCGPSSLTFLNSWGYEWGDNGSFSIENPAVLQLGRGWESSGRMRFYDVFWYEQDLTPGEKQAYDTKMDEEVRQYAAQHTSILELEMQCPVCRDNACIADFTGSIRLAVCPRPHCRKSFRPEPGHLVQALYVRAGLGEI